MGVYNFKCSYDIEMFSVISVKDILKLFSAEIKFLVYSHSDFGYGLISLRFKEDQLEIGMLRSHCMKFPRYTSTP